MGRPLRPEAQHVVNVLRSGGRYYHIEFYGYRLWDGKDYLDVAAPAARAMRHYVKVKKRSKFMVEYELKEGKK